MSIPRMSTVLFRTDKQMVILFILFLPEGTAPYGGHLLAEAKGFHLGEKEEEEKYLFSSIFWSYLCVLKHVLLSFQI